MKTLFANKETRTAKFEILTTNELNAIKGGKGDGLTREESMEHMQDNDAHVDWSKVNEENY